MMSKIEGQNMVKFLTDAKDNFKFKWVLIFKPWFESKPHVYKKGANSIDELKQVIIEEFNKILVSTLMKVQESCLRRMLLCKQNNEKHMEQLL